MFYPHYREPHQSISNQSKQDAATKISLLQADLLQSLVFMEDANFHKN